MTAHTCPACGHQWTAPSLAQVKGGKARWKGCSAKERKAELRAIAIEGWKKRRQAGGTSPK